MKTYIKVVIAALLLLEVNGLAAQTGTVKTIKQYQSGATTVIFDITGGGVTAEVSLANANTDVYKSLLAMVLTAKSAGSNLEFRACNAEGGVWKWCDISLIP